MCRCVGTVKLPYKVKFLAYDMKCSPGEGLHKDALRYARQSAQIYTWVLSFPNSRIEVKQQLAIISTLHNILKLVVNWQTNKHIGLLSKLYTKPLTLLAKVLLYFIPNVLKPVLTCIDLSILEIHCWPTDRLTWQHKEPLSQLKINVSVGKLDRY